MKRPGRGQCGGETLWRTSPAHRRQPPATASLVFRPVSGLASLDALTFPRLMPQWYEARGGRSQSAPALAYRCGGSTGYRSLGSCFPFHPDRRRKRTGHLKTGEIIPMPGSERLQTCGIPPDDQARAVAPAPRATGRRRNSRSVGSARRWQCAPCPRAASDSCALFPAMAGLRAIRPGRFFPGAPKCQETHSEPDLIS